jgi:ParB family chromosome partitioning protein
MEVLDLPIEYLLEAPWNPNEADEATLRRLAASIGRFGTVLPLVVRPLADGYEVLGGNQRLSLYREQSVATVPCVEVRVDDTNARLLAQALNAVHGSDDLNRKAALVRDLLAAMPEADIVAILPDTAQALRGLAALGQQSVELDASLLAWEQAKQARLERVSFPFTPAQREVVEEAIARELPQVTASEEPNRRALALVGICRDWLAEQEKPAQQRGRRPLQVLSPHSTQQPKEA